MSSRPDSGPLARSEGNKRTAGRRPNPERPTVTLV